MAIPRSVRLKLPKAKIIKLMFWQKSMWTYFRLANARQFHFGRMVLIVRASYLEDSARSIHPSLFDAGPK